MRQPPPNDDLERLADRLTIASVRLIRWLKAADPSPRLTGAQASALAVIVYAGEIRPSDLARLEEVKRPTIARTIGELEALRLVERTRDPEDGRGFRLKATAEGARVLAEGQARRIRPLIEALEQMEVGDRSQLARAVEALEAILRSRGV